MKTGHGRKPAPPPPPSEIDFLLFGSKTCAACGAVLPANTEQFSVDSARDDGLSPQCLACRRRRSAEYYARRGRERRLQRRGRT